MANRAIGAACAVALAAIALSTAADAQQPIQIGATMSETGAYSTQGIPARNGYLLCQRHVNDQGGILGRRIECLIYDDKSDGKGAATLL